MVGNTCTSSLPGIVKNIFAQIISEDIQIQIFGSREEILPDATACKIVMVISYIFLV
jgi:hypothetical protein